MVKSLMQTFDDETYRRLKEIKGDRTWRDAILEEFGVENGDE